MTEQEYINATDLTKVTSALAVLMNIIPENSEVISKEDYLLVMNKLYSWEAKIHRSINIKTE